MHDSFALLCLLVNPNDLCMNVHETIKCSVPLFQEFPHKVELCFCDSGHGKIIVVSVKIREGQCRSLAANI